MGHNESAARLGILAHDARIALDRVARGEADAIEGWIAYGAALNAGRTLHRSDEQFGQWIVCNNLLHTPGSPDDEINRPQRAAAMWAAGFPDQFAEARASCESRTVRGIHARWKEIEAERKAEARRVEAEAKAEAARKEAEARASFRAYDGEEPHKATRCGAKLTRWVDLGTPQSNPARRESMQGTGKWPRDRTGGQR